MSIVQDVKITGINKMQKSLVINPDDDPLKPML
jgi:hypothetical protein